MTSIHLNAAGMTDPGLLRDTNEDRMLTLVYQGHKKPVGLFVVCDGMGGHMGGEYASYWAIEAIKQELADLFASSDPRATVLIGQGTLKRGQKQVEVKPFDLPDEAGMEQRVRDAVQKANEVVFEYAQRKPEKAADAGATLTMALVIGNHAVIANAGDSRTYLLRNHQLFQVSRDHSLVANLVQQGQLMPDEVYTHPQRNIIYRFLGQSGQVHLDIFHEALKPGDYLMLCSDGLWEMVRGERQVVHVIEDAGDPRLACEELVKLANLAGGDDNISVVVVKITRPLRHRMDDHGVMW